MNDSLTVSNVYAAYTATSNRSDKNVSELSKLAKNNGIVDSNKYNDDPSMNMDKVIISKEALDRLAGMSLAADSK